MIQPANINNSFLFREIFLFMSITDGLSKKEKRLYIAGILAGLAGGLLSNLFVAYLMKFFDTIHQEHQFLNSTLAVSIELLIVGGAFFGIIIVLLDHLE